MSIFNDVSPACKSVSSAPETTVNGRAGGTPTGRVLQEVLNEQLNRLDKAQRTGNYSLERPLDIIVLTDGVPGEIPMPILSIIKRTNFLLSI